MTKLVMAVIIASMLTAILVVCIAVYQWVVMLIRLLEKMMVVMGHIWKFLLFMITVMVQCLHFVQMMIDFMQGTELIQVVMLVMD